MRRSKVDAAIEILVGNQELDCPDKVRIMNPRYKLRSRPSLSSQARAHQVEQHIEWPTPARAHDDGAPQSDLSRVRSGRCKKYLLPTPGYVDAEIPGIRCSKFVTAEFAGRFVHRTVQGMAVNRCCAGVHPELWRMHGLSNSLAHHTGGLHSGFFDLPAIGCTVAAIHAAAREIDDHISVVDCLGPLSQFAAVPNNYPPWRC